MPRPGPRPYECVRRAWHSDRHQPVRGSIIQQIFRVVNESHSPATKKNKEWQEKLPIVVLKAEEIMYSKANSEAEYMDLVTLWDRVNDAVNTIIRREDSAETGDLLPPCVEAALNLGCVPVRASRSQRQANPRSYLSPRTQESGFVPPQVSNHTVNEQNPQLLPSHSGNQLTSTRPVAANITHLAEPNRQLMQNNISTNPATSSILAFPIAKVPSSSNNQSISAESNTSPSPGSVYPLYYGSHFQPVMPQLGFQVPRNPNAILVGTPIFPSTSETAHIGRLRNLFSCERDESASIRVSQADSKKNHDKAPEAGFDLSLRLGLFEDPSLKPGKVLSHETSNVDSSSLSPRQTKEFSFFPVETSNDPFGFCKSQWNREG
ncbi:Histone acetyltransferase [Actinidia chinensis var. chinensis]|uniref:Histone acetyltransferase n=1 Tax=Actinidia chinensis var. chinensis TaxID=1590841 RepID=A0A2R6S1F1_ACTCC|nr:Histone acetyltransferase [Actinidia chinensis var. chinensis]